MSTISHSAIGVSWRRRQGSYLQNEQSNLSRLGGLDRDTRCAWAFHIWERCSFALRWGHSVWPQTTVLQNYHERIKLLAQLICWRGNSWPWSLESKLSFFDLDLFMVSQAHVPYKSASIHCVIMSHWIRFFKECANSLKYLTFLCLLWFNDFPEKFFQHHDRKKNHVRLCTPYVHSQKTFHHERPTHSIWSLRQWISNKNRLLFQKTITYDHQNIGKFSKKGSQHWNTPRQQRTVFDRRQCFALWI